MELIVVVPFYHQVTCQASSKSFERTWWHQQQPFTVFGAGVRSDTEAVHNKQSISDPCSVELQDSARKTRQGRYSISSGSETMPFAPEGKTIHLTVGFQEERKVP